MFRTVLKRNIDLLSLTANGKSFKTTSREKSKCYADNTFDSTHKQIRYANEFIKMSSARYKPVKNYTKHCPEPKKPLNVRKKCIVCRSQNNFARDECS